MPHARPPLAPRTPPRAHSRWRLARANETPASAHAMVSSPLRRTNPRPRCVHRRVRRARVVVPRRDSAPARDSNRGSPLTAPLAPSRAPSSRRRTRWSRDSSPNHPPPRQRPPARVPPPAREASARSSPRASPTPRATRASPSIDSARWRARRAPTASTRTPRRRFSSRSDPSSRRARRRARAVDGEVLCLDAPDARDPVARRHPGRPSGRRRSRSDRRASAASSTSSPSTSSVASSPGPPRRGRRRRGPLRRARRARSTPRERQLSRPTARARRRRGSRATHRASPRVSRSVRRVGSPGRRRRRRATQGAKDASSRRARRREVCGGWRGGGCSCASREVSADARGGSPHHLCLHLCYYREYDAARQLFVLRTRVAAAKGTASALNDWRADVRAATAEEMGLTDARRREREARRKRSRPDADDEDDAVGADADDSYSEDDSSLPRDARRGAGAREGGWLASKSLPWRVVFFSPEGDAFDSPAEVLAAVGVDASAVGPAAANENGGGGLGNETLADFQTNVAGSSPGSGPRLPDPSRSDGSRPPREPRGLRSPAPGERTAVRAFASRGRRKQVSTPPRICSARRCGPKLNDASVGTEPVRRRLEAAAVGAPRSPFRLASDPLAVEAPTDCDRRGKEMRVPRAEEERPPARSPGGGGGGASGFSRAFVSPPLTPTNLRQWWSPPRSPFGLLEEILWEDAVETSRRVHDAQLHDATAGRSRPLAPLHPHPDAGGGCASRAGGRRRKRRRKTPSETKTPRRGLASIASRISSRRSGYTANERARSCACRRNTSRRDRIGAPRARRARGRRIGTRRGRIGDFAGAAGVVAGSPTQTRAASNAGGVAARSRSVRERRACHVLRGTDGGGAEGPRASVVVRVGGGTEGERREGSREKKGEYRLAEGARDPRATDSRETRLRFFRHGVWCKSGVRRGGRVGIDSRRAISPRMISLEFMYLAHPAWLKPPIVIRQSVESPARWLNFCPFRPTPRAPHRARGRRPVSTSVGLEFRANRDVHLERARVDVARREPALGKSPLGLAGRGPSSWIPSSRSSPSRVCLRTPSPRRPCTGMPSGGFGAVSAVPQQYQSEGMGVMPMNPALQQAALDLSARNALPLSDQHLLLAQMEALPGPSPALGRGRRRAFPRPRSAPEGSMHTPRVRQGVRVVPGSRQARPPLPQRRGAPIRVRATRVRQEVLRAQAPGRARAHAHRRAPVRVQVSRLRQAFPRA